MGSNPTLGMEVCPHLFLLCCPVEGQALRWADPPFKESYKLSIKRFTDSEVNSELEQAIGPKIVKLKKSPICISTVWTLLTCNRSFTVVMNGNYALKFSSYYS